MGLLEAVLPVGVAHAEQFGDPPGLQPLPEEAALIEHAVVKRRNEFITARHCARQAMKQLGIPEVAVLKGNRGVPLWPAGIVGSLTHCEGYRAAALGRATGLRSIGIDAEPRRPLPDGVFEAISRPDERVHVADLGTGDIPFDTLLFCAKEAVFKAWFPLTDRWLGFEDAQVRLTAVDELSGNLSAELLVPGDTISGSPLRTLRGRWCVSRELVVVAITIPVQELPD